MERQDGLARWRWVADQIEDAIRNGEFVGRLPGEVALAERYGVNRHTVRRGLAALGDAGWLRTERGKGTSVVRMGEARIPYPIGTRTRFSENMGRLSRSVGGRLIRAERVQDAALAAALGLAPSTVLHRLECLSVVDGVPLSLATNWLSAKDYPGVVQAYAESGSITQALSREGLVDYVRSETRVTAEAAGPEDGELLRCTSQAILLITRSIDSTPEGKPVQIVRTRFPADRMELVFGMP